MSASGPAKNVPSGLGCPDCNSTRTVVTDSRPSPNGIRRRRRCDACHRRFTTYEYADAILRAGSLATMRELETRIALASRDLAQLHAAIVAHTATYNPLHSRLVEDHQEGKSGG